MGDRQRIALEVRTIVVSTVAALRKPGGDPHAPRRIRARGIQLLSRLEERVVRDGGDAQLLRVIADGRQRIDS